MPLDLLVGGIPQKESQAASFLKQEVVEHLLGRTH
jgi:hypothetical protein